MREIGRGGGEEVRLRWGGRSETVLRESIDDHLEHGWDYVFRMWGLHSGEYDGEGGGGWGINKGRENGPPSQDHTTHHAAPRLSAPRFLFSPFFRH